jgi:hypothetical protein
VTRSSATVQPHGGDRVELTADDFFYCREGVTAHFLMNDDYEQVAFMSSETKRSSSELSLVGAEA